MLEIKLHTMNFIEISVYFVIWKEKILIFKFPSCRHWIRSLMDRNRISDSYWSSNKSRGDLTRPIITDLCHVWHPWLIDQGDEAVDQLQRGALDLMSWFPLYKINMFCYDRECRPHLLLSRVEMARWWSGKHCLYCQNTWGFLSFLAYFGGWKGLLNKKFSLKSFSQ